MKSALSGAAVAAAEPGGMKVVVRYPLVAGELVLRTDSDWTKDIAPDLIIGNNEFHFRISTSMPYAYFKPVLRSVHGELWSVGDNYLALASQAEAIEVFPYFQPDETCSACELRQIEDDRTGRKHTYRVFYPPGYHENHLTRYPVIYMHDGQNLFFPDEAFQGQHWRITETLARLDAMNASRQVIVVGVYPNDRQLDYTLPGYTDYGRFIVERLKPAVDSGYRTLNDPASTAVMGSSLGGVVSFYLAWQYPEVFGLAACMSSTFGWRDDLLERVGTERPPNIRLYLDSGWPRDNFEVTREMRLRLNQRGFVEGANLFYFAFPDALHNEAHWAARTHVPLQLLFSTHPSLA